MNNKANYKKGKRREITELILQNGCLLMRDIPLYCTKVQTMRQQIYIMIKDGTLIKTGRGLNKIVTLNYSKIRKDLNAIDLKLIKYYEAYGLNDAYAAQSEKNSKHYKALRDSETGIFLYGSNIKTLITQKESLFGKNQISGKNYYSSREIKGLNDYTTEKDATGKLTGLTRANGLTTTSGGSYVMYNSYDGILDMDTGESRMQLYCSEIIAQKKLSELKGAILLCKDEYLMQRYLEPGRKTYEYQIDKLFFAYPKVYGLMLTPDGQKLMRLMSEPGWEEKMYRLLIPNYVPNNNYEDISCDGKDADGNYYMVFCSPDVKKLREFVRGARAKSNKEKCRVICFDFQKDFIVAATKGTCKILIVKYSDYLKEIGGDVNEAENY